jgi:hypothetical protein
MRGARELTPAALSDDVIADWLGTMTDFSAG